MDERALKRLAILLVASLIAIFVLKTMLLKAMLLRTATNVGAAKERKAAAEKNQAAPAAVPLPASGVN